MQNEILNLDYHYEKMLIKALNKAGTIKDASQLLGITERTTYSWMKKFNLSKSYQNEETKKMVLYGVLDSSDRG
jgi:transposase-like protein